MFDALRNPSSWSTGLGPGPAGAGWKPHLAGTRGHESSDLLRSWADRICVDDGMMGSSGWTMGAVGKHIKIAIEEPEIHGMEEQGCSFCSSQDACSIYRQFDLDLV